MAALNYHARPSVTQDAFCLTDIEQIRRDNPLPAIAGSTIKLRKVGSEWIGLCPFHSERTPSFTIYEGGQRFKCFGCNATGDVLDFIQAMHGVDFVGALRLVGGGDLPMANFVPADIEREAKAD